MRPCAPKGHAELAMNWDRLAEERHRQISSGIDLSFDHVIAPTAFHLLDGCDSSTVLDVGSGTGEFTARLAAAADSVIAIEPARTSTMIARNVCKYRQNIQFFETPLEDAVDLLTDVGATAAVAVMSLMTTPNLASFAGALAKLLRPQARFVAMLTHPCFWPKYWGYCESSWFQYDKEIFIEAPFAISKCATELTTIHIHRPLEQYVATFADAGFRLEKLAEPIPRPEVQALYPERWAFPRFIGLKWVRTR